jgi:hypothetical protein
VAAQDRLASALARLDAESRALLELSARRGLSDAEIAGLLRSEAGDIARRRDSALARLRAEYEVAEGGPDDLAAELARLDEAAWRSPGPSPPATDSPADRPKRSAAAALGAVLLAGAVAALVVVLAGDQDDPARPAPGGRAQTAPRSDPTTEARPRPRRRRPAPVAGPVQPMQRLNDTRGRGTAQLRREDGRPELRLAVARFLRPRGGGYAVWLFNSPADARRLYATTDTAIQRDIPLPRDFTRYRYAEVARAIPRLDSGHSGLTLLRVPISALRPAR